MSATEYLAAIAEATKAMPDATKQPDREKLQGTIQSAALALAGHCMDAQFWVMKTQEELVVTTKTLGAAQALIAKYHGEQAQESAEPAEETDDSDAHRRQLALGGLLSGIMGDDPSMTVPTWNAAMGRVLSHLVSCALEIGMEDALVKELDERKAAFLAAREPAETEEPK